MTATKTKTGGFHEMMKEMQARHVSIPVDFNMLRNLGDHKLLRPILDDLEKSTDLKVNGGTVSIKMHMDTHDQFHMDCVFDVSKKTAMRSIKSAKNWKDTNSAKILHAIYNNPSVKSKPSPKKASTKAKAATLKPVAKPAPVVDNFPFHLYVEYAGAISQTLDLAIDKAMNTKKNNGKTCGFGVTFPSGKRDIHYSFKTYSGREKAVIALSKYYTANKHLPQVMSINWISLINKTITPE